MIDLGSPPPFQAIGQRLELIRLALGYRSQTSFVAALATHIQVTPQVWNNWERGRHRIPVDAAQSLRDKFGISNDYIYSGSMESLPRRIADNIEQLMGHNPRVWPFRARR